MGITGRTGEASMGIAYKLERPVGELMPIDIPVNEDAKTPP
jgi:hypothetical protein